MAFNSGHGGGDEYDQPMAEINVIPLVDVMLVLLIITMVTSPFLEQGIGVQLPVAEGESLQKEYNESPVTVFVSEDKIIRLGDKPITREDLAKKLLTMFEGKSKKEVFVKADKAVPYGVVAEVMALVKASGITEVGLVTLPQ